MHSESKIIFNKLSVIAPDYGCYFSYICIMPGKVVHTDYTHRYKLLFVPGASEACSYSSFSKKLNFFPTCKDFHN
jgi:hypothetical protein